MSKICILWCITKPGEESGQTKTTTISTVTERDKDTVIKAVKEKAGEPSGWVNFDRSPNPINDKNYTKEDFETIIDPVIAYFKGQLPKK